MPTIEVRPETEELLQQIADALLKSRKVVVITGAGISTNSGIPDFRSENGLYSLIQAQFDAASKLNAMESSDVEDLPIANDSLEPPPTKRRRLSYDNEPILPSVTVATTMPDDVANTTPEPQCLENDLPPTEGPLRPEGRPLDKLQEDSSTEEIGATTVPVNSLQTHMLGEPIQGTRLSRPIISSSPLRQALHASTIASCSDQELPAVLEDESDPKQDLPQDGTITEHMPCSACADHSLRQARRTRAASMPPIPLIELHSSPPQRARSASPPRRGCQCRSSLSRLSLQHPKSNRYSTPRRRGFLDVNSPPLSLPPMSSAGVASARSKTSTRTPSRFRRGHRGINSSPLSSPPPVLFDPYQESSSSTSHQGSSEASSAASSESGDTPPSSMPSLTSQTSNPSRTSLPNLKGRDLFDVSIWADPVRTSVFYTFASTLRQKSRDVQPTASHHFISHLRDRGKLVRCYTQNIDQIEEKVGLSTSLQQGPGSRGRFSRKSTGGSSNNTTDTTDGKDTTTVNNGGVECVFLHGSLQSLRCFLCGQVCEWDAEGRHLETLSGRQPECPHCAGATAARQERGKRALGVGKLRPDIVLYGEEHPNAHLIDPLVKHDLALYPDFMLILGTSLKVHGLKVIVREFARAVHSKGGKVVFVNFTKAPESAWGDIIDYWIRWDCDAWVANLQQRIPLLWLPPGTKLPKRKRESSSLEKVSKKRSLVKQGSSIVVRTPGADTTVTEDAITVREPLPAEPFGDPSNLDVGNSVTVAGSLENMATAGDAAVSGNPPSDAVATTSEVPPAPGLTLPADAPSGHTPSGAASTTAQVEPAATAPTMDQTSATATAPTAGVPVSDAALMTAPATRPPKTPKAPAARPMALREDRLNAAYLTWQVSRDLRRLSGSTTELSTFSSPIVRTKVIHTPRSSAKTTPQSSSSAQANELVPSTSPSNVSPSLRLPRGSLPQASVPEDASHGAHVLEDPHPDTAIEVRGIAQEGLVLVDTSPEEAIQQAPMPEEAVQPDTTDEAFQDDTAEQALPQGITGEGTEINTSLEQVAQGGPSPEALAESSRLAQEPRSVFPPPSSLSSALSSVGPTSPLALTAFVPGAPSSPATTSPAQPLEKQQRKSLPGKDQGSEPRPRRTLRSSLPAVSAPSPLSGKSASSKQDKKVRPRQAKGWVWVGKDDPEVLALEQRQASNWGGIGKTAQPPVPLPTDAQPEDGRKKRKERNAIGWVYVPPNGPEARELEMRQASHWGGIDKNGQPPAPLPTEAQSDGGENKKKKRDKPRQSKGWVDIPADGPEAQELQMRQARHWGVGLEDARRTPALPAQTSRSTPTLPDESIQTTLTLQVDATPEDVTANTAPPAKGTKRKRREKGKGWSLMPDDAPEAQELQMRQARNSGVSLDGSAPESHSIYDALKANPRQRKRKTIDGVEVPSAGSVRTPRRSLPPPTPAASMPINAHATAIFQLLPDVNEILPMPVAQARAPASKQTGPDKENHSMLSPQIVSEITFAPTHHLKLAPMQSRPPPLTFQAGVELPHAKLQQMELLSPPPGPPAAMAPTVGRPKSGHVLGQTAFAINDSLLFHFRSPPRIWTPEDQLREEAAALALSSLKTGLR